MSAVRVGRPALTSRLDGYTVAMVLPVVAAVTGVAYWLLAPADGLSAHLGAAVAMTLVMMGPYAVPLGQAVAQAALWHQAAAAVAVVVLTFLAAWCLASLGLHLVGAALAAALSPSAAVAAVALGCVVGQLSWQRQARLAACRFTRPVRPGRPLRSAAGWGLAAMLRCSRVCAVPMLLMSLAPTLLGGLAVTALLWGERFAARPALRGGLAVGYLAVAVVLVRSLGAPTPTTFLSGHQHG